MAEGLPDGSRSDLQVFLSIKILTIRFDLFFGAPAKKKGQGHGRSVIFLRQGKRNNYSPPPSLAPRLLQAWKAGRPFQPDLLLHGQRYLEAGAGLWACGWRRNSPATLYFSWELVGILNRRVCVMTQLTKRHSKVTLRISSFPPLPLRWKSL